MDFFRKLLGVATPSVREGRGILLSENLGLDYYNGFVMLLNGTSLHISRAMVTREYSQNLFEHRVLTFWTFLGAGKVWGLLWTFFAI